VCWSWSWSWSWRTSVDLRPQTVVGQMISVHDRRRRRRRTRSGVRFDRVGEVVEKEKDSQVGQTQKGVEMDDVLHFVSTLSAHFSLARLSLRPPSPCAPILAVQGHVCMYIIVPYSAVLRTLCMYLGMWTRTSTSTYIHTYRHTYIHPAIHHVRHVRPRPIFTCWR
jgi:hypothetical protein